MTTRLKVKVVRRSVLKLKVLPRLPANLIGSDFITVTRDGLEYTVRPDYTIMNPIPISDLAATIIAVFDLADNQFKPLTLADFVNGTGTNPTQIVTGAGDVTVLPATRLLIMNRTANESPSKINLPAGAAKIGDVKIVDWKGNAGVFPHDVYPAGAEKFNGNLSQWQIGADGASLVFNPIPSLGYAV